MIDPYPVPLPPAVLSPDAPDWVPALTEDELPEPAKAWRIDGTGSAAWAMAHYAEADAAISAIEAQAVEWYQRIDEWMKHEAAPHRRTLEFFDGELRRYALDVREADPKRKSVVLPNGKVQTTGTSAKVVVTDEDAVIRWAAREAPEIIRPAFKVLLTELRQRVKVSQVLTLAWVTNSCGCKVSVRDDEGLSIPDVGTETVCSECGADALIGMIEPLGFRWLATDGEGCHVPGVDVEEPSVTAKVVLG
jgi:hypothetical protein